MRAFVVDAFADEIFRGNQAGVVIPDTVLSADLMQKIAAD
ncbi:MAG: PhzF family phenazine biosynthesis protein, partial [Clostridia bacterium]|nr:PhzF family phenazine biosynthesis protein [Clostridia bacterium]